MILRGYPTTFATMVAVIALGAASLAGCSGDDESSSSTSTATQSSTSAPDTTDRPEPTFPPIPTNAAVNSSSDADGSTDPDGDDDGADDPDSDTNANGDTNDSGDADAQSGESDGQQRGGESGNGQTNNGDANGNNSPGFNSGNDDELFADYPLPPMTDEGIEEALSFFDEDEVQVSAWGDIDGDGDEDAIATISICAASCGTELFLMLNINGGADMSSATFEGYNGVGAEQATLRSIEIDGSTVTLVGTGICGDLPPGGPGEEGTCNAEVERTAIYQYSYDSLRLTSINPPPEA